MLAQNAQAASIDFNCGPSLCGGTMSATFSGTTATSATASGVTVVNDAGPVDDQNLNFTLAFNLTGAAPNISLTENSGVDSSTLTGTILSGSGFAFGGTVDLDLSVVWTTLPADFAAFLGSSTGAGINTNVFIQGGTGQSIDVNIQPTPEPATLLLFGTGLLGLGGLVRRKLNV